MKLAKLIEKMSYEQAVRLCDLMTQFRMDYETKLKNMKYERVIR